MNILLKARILLVASVIALIAAPVIMMGGAFSPDSLFISLALFIMGALGLYAGMKTMARHAEKSDPSL